MQEQLLKIIKHGEIRVFFVHIFSLFAKTINKRGGIMIITNIIALSILILGALNWFTVGVFSWNLLSAIFGIGVFSWNLLSWMFGVGVFVRILYTLVGIAGIWMFIQLIVRRTKLFNQDDTMRRG